MPNLLDLLKNVALKRMATTAVRQALTALGVYLVGRGYTTDSDWAAIALDLSPIVIAFAWSVLEKALADKREEVALTLPEDSTKHDVTAAINLGV